MQPFKNILCVLPADSSHCVTLERAVSLAENSQAQLTVIDVSPHVRAGITLSGRNARSADLQAAMANERLQALQALTEPYRQRTSIRHEVPAGTAFLEIIRTVLRNGHDLVIKPAENPRFIQRMFGSDDMQLLRACPCPVWITRPEEQSSYRSILVAIDFDMDADPMPAHPVERDLNGEILELSCSLALSDFATLQVLHVWNAPGESIIRTWSDDPDEAAARYIRGEHARHQKRLNAVRTQLRDHLGTAAYRYLSPRFHLRRGIPATAIPEATKELQADLVLMGTVARAGIAGLLIGNTAEAVLEQLTCSVLAVKPPGFVSPISLGEYSAMHG